MKRAMRIVSAAMLALAMGCGFGNGQITSEAREVGDFEVIEATRGVIVTVTYGEPASLTIETDSNLLPLVETWVRDGKLHLGIVGGQAAYATQGVHASIVAPRLTRIEATSSASVLLERPIQPELTIDATSSSRVEVRDVAVERLTALATSSASVILLGTADSLDARTTSGASLAAGALRARAVHLEATSTSNGTVTAEDEISGTVDSLASFVVRGNPARNSLKVESGGSVHYGQ